MSFRTGPGLLPRRKQAAAGAARRWANSRTQLPPPEVPGNPPHPEPGSAPQAGVPMTDGTPAACRQKNAQEFLAGKVPGVMAQYAPGLFSTLQHTHSAHPAPDEDADAVQQLVEWRENAPYG